MNRFSNVSLFNTYRFKAESILKENLPECKDYFLNISEIPAIICLIFSLSSFQQYI